MISHQLTGVVKSGGMFMVLSLGVLARLGLAATLEESTAGVLPLVYCLEVQLTHSRQRYGTGVQIAPGRLLTVWHEIDGGGGIRVYSHDGFISPAQVLAKDATDDLVLLAIAPRTGTIILNEMPPPTGEAVFAIGCPRGARQTVHKGTVRKPGRLLQGSRLIEIAMGIAQGDSGAPLFDRQGHLVGLVRGYLEGENTISYAIPSTILVSFLSQAGLPVDKLLDYGQIERLIEEGGDEEAESLLMTHIGEAQEDYRPFMHLAALHHHRGEYLEALRWYLQAAERAPRQFEIYRGLCQTYRKLGKAEAARRSCAYATELRGGNGE